MTSINIRHSTDTDLVDTDTGLCGSKSGSQKFDNYDGIQKHHFTPRPPPPKKTKNKKKTNKQTNKKKHKKTCRYIITRSLTVAERRPDN